MVDGLVIGCHTPRAMVVAWPSEPAENGAREVNDVDKGRRIEELEQEVVDLRRLLSAVHAVSALGVTSAPPDTHPAPLPAPSC